MLNFVLFVVALLQLLHIQHGFQLNHGKRMNLHSIDMSDNNNNKMNLKKRLGVILTATRLGIPTNILSGTSLQNSFKKLIVCHLKINGGQCIYVVYIIDRRYVPRLTLFS